MTAFAQEFHVAEGSFEISFLPQPSIEGVQAMHFEKTFSGGLSGSSRGHMLSIRTEVEGSAAYVALELVETTLLGVEGSFALQHRGTRKRGSDSLFLEIVPDSGVGGLVGISGSMTIQISEGKHHYRIEYSLTKYETPC